MPTAIVTTNALRDQFSPSFLPSTVRLISDLLDKPFKGVAVILQNDVAMDVYHAGDHVVWIRVIGVGDFADDKKNDEYVSKITQHVSEDTGIPCDLISVSLQDISPAQVGFVGGELALDRIRRRKAASLVTATGQGASTVS
ncbi:macrophage migration inhibitory factor-like [Diadema setosum]|uniref:macrophage migration inhibitory factor-like n=1 Tax=Diadema setosum TaxID=31175 RepID=UPI003B3BBABE